MTTNQYTIHSGGALGTDTVFGLLAKEYDITVNHYYYGQRSTYNAPNGNIHITDQDYNEGKIMSAKSAQYNWGYKYATMKDPRLCRNWAQVKYSDTIFAVGNIVNIGERVFPNQPNDTRLAINQCVAGGTGYAVSMAILFKKPIYVFEQNKDHWFKYDYSSNQFIECECPILTKNSAGIGTREIQLNSVKALQQLFRNTFNQGVTND